MPAHPPLEQTGWHLGGSAIPRVQDDAEGNLRRIGSAFQDHSLGQRLNDPGYQFVFEQRLDNSGMLHLRTENPQAIVDTVQTALIDVAGAPDGVAVRVSAPEATTWLAFLSIVNRASALYTRDTAHVNMLNAIPNFLERTRLPTAPGANLAEPIEQPQCPPEELCIRILDTLWKNLHVNWSMVGSVLLGQWAPPSLEQTRLHLSLIHI